MPRTRLLILLIALSLSITSCSKSGNINTTTSNASVNVSTVYAPPPTPEPTLDDLAVRKAREAWDRLWTMCGDVAVTRSGRMFVERKGINFRAEPNRLNEADRMNGINWKGHVAATYTVERTHFGSWGEWSNSGSYRTPREYVVQKNGVWEVHGNYGYKAGQDFKIECSEVPKD